MFTLLVKLQKHIKPFFRVVGLVSWANKEDRLILS